MTQASLLDAIAVTQAPDPIPAPHQTRETLNGKLAAYFKARPNQWIDGRELATVAGFYAFRSRVSDLRHAPYFMTIENKQERHPWGVASFYRYVPEEQ